MHTVSGCFIWGLKKLSIRGSVLFTVSSLEIHERESCKKQAGSNMSAFRAWSIYADSTVHCHGFCSPPLPIIMGGNYNAKILWGQNFSYISGGTNLYGGEIFITTISLFHFFRNNTHPEKWSVSVKNFFTKSDCYLPTSSNLLKNSLQKTSLFVLFELFPTGLLKYVWPFVTTQHEWVNNFPGFFRRTLTNSSFHVK